MNSNVVIVVLVACVIALFVALGLYDGTTRIDHFKQVCSANGGTTVWDGKSYQCLLPCKVGLK